MAEPPMTDIVPLPVFDWIKYRKPRRQREIVDVLKKYSQAISNGGHVQPVVRDSFSQYVEIKNYLVGYPKMSVHRWAPKEYVELSPTSEQQVGARADHLSRGSASQLPNAGPSVAQFTDPSQQQAARSSRGKDRVSDQSSLLKATRDSSAHSSHSVATSAVVPRNRIAGLEERLLWEEGTILQKEQGLTPFPHQATGLGFTLTAQMLHAAYASSNEVVGMIMKAPFSEFSEEKKPHCYLSRHENYTRLRAQIQPYVDQISEQKRQRNPPDVSQALFQTYLETLNDTSVFLDMQLEELDNWFFSQPAFIQQWASLGLEWKTQRRKAEAEQRAVQLVEEAIEEFRQQQDVEMTEGEEQPVEEGDEEAASSETSSESDDENTDFDTSDHDDDDDDEDDPYPPGTAYKGPGGRNPRLLVNIAPAP